MFRKFISGLLFGAGFAIAFVAVISIAMAMFSGSSIELPRPIETDVPPILEKAPSRFLGSPSVYAGGFQMGGSTVLRAGDGEIVGFVQADGAPLAGLTLRLALNGKVMSQWATSDDLGRYSISVPSGDYRIDGFELDQEIADQLLAGYIEAPSQSHGSGATIAVNKETPGVGVDFSFIKPVEKLESEKEFAAKQSVSISWEAYPNASEYVIQLYEKPNPHDFQRKSVYSWPRRPRTTVTWFEFEADTSILRPGYYYSFEVSAIDDQGGVISRSPRTSQGFDFHIME